MKTKLSLSVFILLVLLAGALSNLRLSSRIKTSLTNTEREFADYDDIDGTGIFSPPVLGTNLSNFISITLIKFNFFDQTLETNPSLNSLYRAHSPPTQA